MTDEFPMKRADFIEYLKLKGIGSAVHLPDSYPPSTRVHGSEQPDSCPISTGLASSVLSLPVHPLLDQKELAYICEVVNQVR